GTPLKKAISLVGRTRNVVVQGEEGQKLLMKKPPPMGGGFLVLRCKVLVFVAIAAALTAIAVTAAITTVAATVSATVSTALVAESATIASVASATAEAGAITFGAGPCLVHYEIAAMEILPIGCFNGC